MRTVESAVIDSVGNVQRSETGVGQVRSHFVQLQHLAVSINKCPFLIGTFAISYHLTLIIDRPGEARGVEPEKSTQNPGHNLWIDPFAP